MMNARVAGSKLFNIIYIMRKSDRLASGVHGRMIFRYVKIIALMCGRVQSAGSGSEILQSGVCFFLPLVVDATGPAQANYSLPGLFYLPYLSPASITPGIPYRM